MRCLSFGVKDEMIFLINNYFTRYIQGIPQRRRDIILTGLGNGKEPGEKVPSDGWSFEI